LQVDGIDFLKEETLLLHSDIDHLIEEENKINGVFPYPETFFALLSSPSALYQIDDPLPTSLSPQDPFGDNNQTWAPDVRFLYELLQSCCAHMPLKMVTQQDWPRVLLGDMVVKEGEEGVMSQSIGTDFTASPLSESPPENQLLECEWPFLGILLFYLSLSAFPACST